VEPNPRATVNRAEVLDLVRMVVRIEVERDDAVLRRILSLRRGDVDVAVATNGEMAERAQPLCNHRRVKSGRQHETVWLA